MATPIFIMANLRDHSHITQSTDTVLLSCSAASQLLSYGAAIGTEWVNNANRVECITLMRMKQKSVPNLFIFNYRDVERDFAHLFFLFYYSTLGAPYDSRNTTYIPLYSRIEYKHYLFQYRHQKVYIC